MATYNSIRSDNQSELDSLSAKSSAGVYACGYRYRKWFGVRRSTWFLLFYMVTYAGFLVAAGYTMACLEWENEQLLKAQVHELKSTFLKDHPSVKSECVEICFEAYAILCVHACREINDQLSLSFCPSKKLMLSSAIVSHEYYSYVLFM